MLLLALSVLTLSACGNTMNISTTDGDDFEASDDEVEADGDSSADGDSDGENTVDGDAELVEDSDSEVAEEEVDSEEEIDMAFCDDPLELPKNASIVIGDAHSGSREFFDSDFVFDRNGDIISADAYGNLIRTTSDGERTVWVAKAVKRARGMAYLSTGELVVADSGLGRLIKVYSEGQIRVLTRHLDFPNGLDVDKDDFIYVSEASRAAISRVDPQTGKLETLAVGFRAAANGLSFSPDYNTLYFAAQEDGSIYEMQRNRSDGGFGDPELIAVVPGLGGPCYDKSIDDECTENDIEGTCQEDVFGELYCRPKGVCDGLTVGDVCEVDYRNGTCQEGEDGFLICVPAMPCDGLMEGDDCTTEYGYPGVCKSDDAEGLYCEEVSACEGLNLGDECVEWGAVGTCQDDGSGGLYCRPEGVCDNLEVGDHCEEWGTVGTCQEDEGGILYCRAAGVCDGMNIGDHCEEWGTVGTCQDDGSGSGWLYCKAIQPCDGLDAGDICTLDGEEGVCMSDYEGGLYCLLPNSCDGLNENDVCDLEDGVQGICVYGWMGILECQYVDPCPHLSEGHSCVNYDGEAGICRADMWPGSLSCQTLSSCYGLDLGAACTEDESDGYCADTLNGYLYCQTSEPCSESAPGDTCTDPYSYNDGVCTVTGEDLFCAAANPCAAAEIGDTCQRNDMWGKKAAYDQEAPWLQNGTCQLSSDNIMYCKLVQPCDGLQPGDICTTSWGTSGICTGDGDSLYCEEQSNPCDYSSPGDICQLSEDEEGICVDDGQGGLICSPADPCNALEEGDACNTALGAGTCKKNDDDTLYCLLNPDCQGKADGDACMNSRTALAGTCISAAGERLLCQPASPCEDKSLGDACIGRKGLEGICADNDQDGLLFCSTGGGGMLHGLDTDLCGNLYVTDDYSDAVWRFPPDGSAAEIVAATLYSPVSGIAWGIEKGGWNPDSLYLAIAGGKEILEVELGIPGRRIVRPADEPVSPMGNAEAEEVDCLNLPDAPVSTTQLNKPRGYHDVAFDSEGYIVGHDGFNLVRVSYDDQVQLFASGLTGAQGMDWLPDGSLVVATDVGIISVQPSGAQVTLASEIYAYGVTIGADGMVYAADNTTLYRINPKTDPATVDEYLEPGVISQIEGTWAPRTINFDFDHTLMYVGTWSEDVFVISLDKNLNPIGKPRLFARIPGDYNWMDGMGVDYCGNVYMPNYESSSTYRITPDGITSLYLRQNSATYGHGLEFGSGIGGWKANAIYMPQPYNSNMVVEVVVGAPKRP